MLILIEGPDNTGKTTLAEMIQQRMPFDFHYHHCSKPKNSDPFQEYFSLFINLAVDHKNVVMDRGHLGEYVYSKLWRGGLSMKLRDFDLLTNIARKVFNGLVVVHATAPVDVIIQRCKDNNEELLKEDQVKKCVQLFDEIIMRSASDALRYDSSKVSTSDALLEVVEYMNREAKSCE